MNNFIIVGTQRSGSGMLADILNAHPQVLCGWEWTQTVAPYSRLSIAKKALSGDFSGLSLREQSYLAARFEGCIRWLGYRRLFRSSDKWLIHPGINPALWLDRFNGHIQWIKNQPDLHVVHIVRVDTLSWLKSKYISKENRSYKNGMYDTSRKIVIPRKRAIKRVRSKNRVDLELHKLRRTNPYLEMFYEDCSLDSELASRKIDEFFGLDSRLRLGTMQTRNKQSTEDIGNYVENYASLRTAIADRNLEKSVLYPQD